MQSKILIIDDEPEVRRLVAEVLEDEHYATFQGGDLEGALQLAALYDPTVVFLDLWLNGDSTGGFLILERLREQYPDLPVVMISGHGTIEVALDAVQRGAYDFIEKPFVVERLLSVAKRACEMAHLKRENRQLRKKASRDSPLLGKSSAITEVLHIIDKAAPTNSRIFIYSPIGGGSEAVAALVHAHSQRKQAPFVTESCSAINIERLNADLFGEEIPGSPPRLGLFEKAEGGTLFLEEVTDMPLDVQSKLLRVLQENTFTRIGGTRELTANVRIISSTTLPRKSPQLKDGRFRQDLYYRLSVVPIEIPPLSHRREDILPTVEYFLEHSENFFGLPSRKMSAELLSVLQSYSWPGNIRQVRNVVEWMLIMAAGSGDSEIGLSFLPPEIANSTEESIPSARAATLIGLPLREARELFEREYLATQVRRFSGNISQTAEFIGMERSALHRKLRSLQVSVNRGGDPDEDEETSTLKAASMRTS